MSLHLLHNVFIDVTLVGNFCRSKLAINRLIIQQLINVINRSFLQRYFIFFLFFLRGRVKLVNILCKRLCLRRVTPSAAILGRGSVAKASRWIVKVNGRFCIAEEWGQERQTDGRLCYSCYRVSRDSGLRFYMLTQHHRELCSTLYTGTYQFHQEAENDDGLNNF